MNATEFETAQEAAKVAYSWFETAYRVEGDSDTRYTRCKDGAPEWVRDLVQSAHGDFFPDDWRYDCIQAACEFIADNEDYEDMSGEFADSQVDVYTGRRLAWLASNLYRAGYCDEAVEDLGIGQVGIIDMIGSGQYQEASEVYALVYRALEEAVA